MKPVALPLFVFYVLDNELLSLLLVNIFLSFFIAFTLGRQRALGFWGSLFICFFLSSLIGLIIILLSKTKNEQQKKDDDYMRTFNAVTAQDEVGKLKVMKQSGIISKKEFEEEKKRLLGCEASDK